MVENAVRQAEIACNRCSLGLGRIAAEGHEAVLQLAVLLHRLGGDRHVRVSHVESSLVHADHDLAETPCVEDAGAGEVLRVSGTRVLRKITDFTGRVDCAAGGEFLTGQHLRQGRLTCPVSPDQADLVPAFDSEGDVLHEHACANTQFEVVHAEHRQSPIV